jgi:hypothetical protein
MGGVGEVCECVYTVGGEENLGKIVKCQGKGDF